MWCSDPDQQDARLRAMPGISRRACLMLAPVGLLSACGFKLRGSAELPFRTLFLNVSPNSAFASEFRRYLRIGTRTEVVDDPAQAEARLELLQEAREREIVAFSSAGRPREFQLRYRVRFRLHDGREREFIPSTEILLRRDLTTSDDLVLSKEQEELALYRDMQTDMVQQLLRRIAAVQR